MRVAEKNEATYSDWVLFQMLTFIGLCQVRILQNLKNYDGNQQNWLAQLVCCSICVPELSRLFHQVKSWTFCSKFPPDIIVAQGVYCTAFVTLCIQLRVLHHAVSSALLFFASCASLFPTERKLRISLSNRTKSYQGKGRRFLCDGALTKSTILL